MEQKKGKFSYVIVIGLLLITIGLLLAALLTRKPAQNNTETEAQLPVMEITDDVRIGYATEGVTIVDDENALQAAYDEAVKNAEENQIALWYKNDAYSYDGQNFSCFIGNSSDNMYDMYLDIYSDASMQDEIYLSQLIRPGTAFETITLNRSFAPGEYRFYVVHTLVDTTENEQLIKGQLTVTVDFHIIGDNG